ncbi:hypothetical protein Pint_33674 [Pistacia integerrima]|uniref:Uncharacterized protein n=1 Tax=Pistacia integerrima TaxID=434235 RepID=A0ACC0X2V1_9ROSI|nr:hypothetical protein Pint_33674 [Pistacia integerrima]
MKITAKTCILVLQLLCILFYSGNGIHALSYDYSATTEARKYFFIIEL